MLIGHRPAATGTHLAFCTSAPPDAIIKGSTGVFINNLPAARMGDFTTHGGVIVTGEPTVLIGELGSPSGSGFAGLGAVMGGLVASGIHPSHLAKAPKPFDCQGNWNNTVADVNKIANMKDPLARNQKITASYATMYKQNSNLQWAGLGAVVSRNAGCAMVKSQGIADASNKAIGDQAESSSEPAPNLLDMGTAFSATVAHDALADTNQLIYRTVAPTMTFISKYGAKQLKACMDSGAIPVQDHLKDRVPNDKLPNNAVPPQLVPAVDKLAQSEALPDGDPEKANLDRRAADRIARYEQTGVVQQRIYDPSWTVRRVMQANQVLSQYQWGRDLGATPPEVAMSVDCSATNRIPYQGSILDSNDRVDYYNKLTKVMSQMSPNDVGRLMTQLQGQSPF